ncbi:assimilatory nitrate reductase catalytic subunit [Sphingobium fontiphilum]|uniref:Assimilatory nitrate reductase catalytic subunit n=1 Tax=Sphingobium fontiphilum TaxID=944425 RepID=A0A7W6GPG0_9SPHN|nr:nitrate reductase [Sphingobium fontiphilum]MBB3982368.1 assimilatory nitrate reductase catalytic subunit [Sphingobium fontiphilum]
MNAIRTTCAYCGVGCGISAVPTGERTVAITGDATHPANFGRLCSKGTHLGETVGLEGRLLHPMIGEERVDWDEALNLVAGRFAQTIRNHGPDSVAFYVSGQLLTEDYYVANKLMKGFIGSGNIDTNSRLCMSSAVAAHNRAFGEDVVPCSYADLEEADLILLVGSNTAWCHPVIWQRIEAAREARGAKLVVIDPRRTETAERADLHVALRPDGDVALFNGLLAAMRDRGGFDAAYIAQHVDMPEDFIASLAIDLPGIGIDAAAFDALADMVAATPRMVTLFSQGANQSSSGTDKGNAIINLHLATGRIGRAGMGPFSITGQPNAMGGREVGGLANMLAAHMGFSDAECAAAQDFWQSPTIARAPGLKAVDLFRAVHEGKVKALWIMATNPAVSMPDAGFVREALARCDFVVASEVIAETDSARFAHVRLPALGWGEKDGTVTNSERIVSRQRALLAAPGDVRADWDIVSDVARRMGFGAGFGYRRAADIFREYCAQTGFRNDGARMLDLSQWAGISDADYDGWAPWQWGGVSPFASGRFSTPDGRARIVAVDAPAAPAADPAFPFRLNTGRYRDQWHTMTRTGLSPKLSRHRREPLVEVHAHDAARLGLTEGSIARVATLQGESRYRVSLSDGQRPGELFVPIHWTDTLSSGGRTGRLPAPVTDPVSGQPAFKNTAASIEPFESDWRGFMVSAEPVAIAIDCYWTRARGEHGWLTELVGQGAIDIDALLPHGQRIEAQDGARGTIRVAVRDDDGRLRAALFLTRSGLLPSRDWILGQLGAPEGASGSELLAGRSADPAPDNGPTLCVCFDVGMFAITRAIREQSLTSVETVGAAIRAGTNCGSCRPAISRLIAQTAKEDACVNA